MRKRPAGPPRTLALAVLVAAGACATSPSVPRPDALPAPDASGASAPASAPEDAGPRYFGEDEVDRPARPLSPIDPAYPPPLRALGVEGEVEARVVVRADGSVGGARLLSSSDPGFTAAVREALAAVRFQPAERAGRPVASWVTLRLRFRLED